MSVDLLQVTHCNINCSDLERSLAFYRDLVGLVPGTHTNPGPQPGEGFGIDGTARWDAYMMMDERGHLGPVIDLLEWKEPKPYGKPYAEANHLGFYRICLITPDLAALYERFVAAGVVCLSPPCDVPVDPASGLVVRALFTRDPDGTLVEFIERKEATGVRLAHVNVNCSDLERSLEWYQRVLGVELGGRGRPEPASGEVFGLDGDVLYEAAFLFPKGQREFAIDLLEWKQPKPVGTPYAHGNHLGIYRMAFLVADINSSYAELRAQGVECPEPVFLDMGPEVPVDGVWACFFPDPDGTCLEFIESPRLAAPEGSA